MENFDDYSSSGLVSDFQGSYVPQSSRDEGSGWIGRSDYRRSRRVRVISSDAGGSKWVRKAQSQNLKKIFSTLASEIETKYGPTAFFQDIHSCPQYLQIIGMGPSIVPILLADLEEHGRPWFLALRVITRASVGDEVEAGNLRQLAAAWIKWGKENGVS